MKDVNFAYLILAHKNLEQLEVLVNLITSYPCNGCFIMLDKSLSQEEADNFYDKIDLNQVKLFQSDIKLLWGDYSLVSKTLFLLKDAVSHGFKYCHLISGQDFPIQPMENINVFFSKTEMNYIDFFPLPRESRDWGALGGLDRYFFNKNGTSKILPYGISCLFGGSQWWSLNFDCCRYILDFIDRRNDYVEFYKNTYIPDESFFQTIILNSPLKETIINWNARYINWTDGPDYPKIMEESDFKFLEETRCLFARKFDMTVDVEILKKIINKIL